MRHLLLDGDVLVYSTAFGAQKTRYCHQGNWFDSSQECQTYCELNNINYRALRKEGAITSQVEVLPEGVCNNILKMKLDSIKAACKSTSYTLFLTGEGNYREKYAVTKGYKANRTQPKPQHYEYVRKLVLSSKRAVLTDGIEADDAMGIAMTKAPDSVICTIDKDLGMIPGRHYNWDSGAMYNVGPTDAFYFFCKQMLTGDSTDNIPGIPRMGDKKAEAILAQHRGDATACWRAVVDAYSEVENSEAYMQEMMLLLWIQREPGQMITPHEISTKYLIGMV